MTIDTKVVNISPEADTYVYNLYPTSNYGTATTVMAYCFNTQYMARALFRFNLSSVPVGATITSATLYLYQATSQISATLTLKNIPVANRTWAETGVTWNNKPTVETYPNIPIVIPTVTNTWEVYDITSYVTDQYNAGVKAEFSIQGPESGTFNGRAYWNSKENATTTTRPYLAITYKLPEPTIYVTSDNPSTYPTWDAENFSGFVYDSKHRGKPEQLYIGSTMTALDASRTIPTGNLSYSTTKTLIDFAAFNSDGVMVNGASSYPAVGWQGEKWVAINGNVSKIGKLVYEMGRDDKRTLVANQVWDLGSGYELTVLAINAASTPRTVQFNLKKDGIVLTTIIGQTPVSNSVADKQLAVSNYTTTILGETNTLVFSVYVSSIFQGATSAMVQFKYAWLMDTSTAMQIAVGQLYGVFTVTTANINTIILSNSNTVSLSRNSESTIIGNLKFVIADSTELRFYPKINYTITGTYPIRGFVYNTPDDVAALPKWTGKNFTGLLYNSKSNYIGETLMITGYTMSYLESTRSIPTYGLIYITNKVSTDFKVFEQKALTINGASSYSAIGWQTEKWVAINNNAQKIGKLVYEMGINDKKTLTVNETWSLGAGYSLTIVAIDAVAGTVSVNLMKDGVSINQATIPRYGVYYYAPTILGEVGSLVFSAYVDTIFAGATTTMTQFKYAWLMDETSATQISTANIFGALEVTTANSNYITLTNTTYSISLYQNSQSTIIGNLHFTIADSTELRFYPGFDYIIAAPPIGPIIGAINMAPSKTSCTELCSLTVDVSWGNSGDTSGTFIPSIIVDNGTPITLPSETLAPGIGITRTFNITGLAVGTHTICPSPN